NSAKAGTVFFVPTVRAGPHIARWSMLKKREFFDSLHRFQLYPALLCVKVNLVYKRGCYRRL
ncbi:MAG: hypothetical protein ACK2UN_07595, partial [Candidatus Promineifilaceae bacterium]